MNLDQLEQQALTGKGCSFKEALWLAKKTEESALFSTTTKIREAFFGNKVQLCSIINAKSGSCDMDCHFCSQSGKNATPIDEYPFLNKETIEPQIKQIISDNERHCGIVTSGGKLSSSEHQSLVELCATINSKSPAPLCASLGRLSINELEQLKEAGIVRYHHNLETSENFYPEICSTQTWESRLQTVKRAQKVGLEVCCGGLFGLGESWKDRIELAISLRENSITSIPINFLYAHEGTPLASIRSLSASEALRIIAIYRFIIPKATLRICGGRDHVLKDRQKELFAAGANGMMTGNYLTVSGQEPSRDQEMIYKLGLEIQSTK